MNKIGQALVGFEAPFVSSHTHNYTTLGPALPPTGKGCGC
tara:strand:- start:1467 stop:1586 length:120 start_codon:yes stop_codon:yes gene_type:complete